MLEGLEKDILYFIHDKLSSPFMDEFMIFMSKIGKDGIIWIAICALLMISRKTRYIALVALVALFISLGTDDILKNLFARPRPFMVIPDLHLIINAPNSYSFPSGHASSSFAACGVFGVYFKKFYAFLSYVLAILISISRMYLYVHYPTDILGGIFVGFLCSFIAILLFDRYKRTQEMKLKTS